MASEERRDLTAIAENKLGIQSSRFAILQDPATKLWHWVVLVTSPKYRPIAVPSIHGYMTPEGAIASAVGNYHEPETHHAGEAS